MITKSLLVKFVLLIIFSVLLLVSFVGYYLFSAGPLKEDITLIIAPHESISKTLQDNGVISQQTLFSVITRLYSHYSTLKSGEYKFQANITPLELLKILAKGKSIIHKLIIPEGTTVTQILDRINTDNIFQGSKITDIKEGELMPDTYYYSYGNNREILIKTMQSKMKQALNEIVKKLPSDSPIKSSNDLLTLASIIEKETDLENERPLIAAVFLNRLKKGMKLQSDPTTIYAITLGAYKLNRKLTRQDLEIASEYNTYFTKALPPGPICCPGKSSLEAIINPASTNALFFVATGKGGHNFAETLEEHLKNVEIYRSIIKQSNNDNISLDQP